KMEIFYVQRGAILRYLPSPVTNLRSLFHTLRLVALYLPPLPVDKMLEDAEVDLIKIEGDELYKRSRYVTAFIFVYLQCSKLFIDLIQNSLSVLSAGRTHSIAPCNRHVADFSVCDGKPF